MYKPGSFKPLMKIGVFVTMQLWDGHRGVHICADAPRCGRAAGEPHRRQRRGGLCTRSEPGSTMRNPLVPRFLAGMDCRLARFDAQLGLVELLVPALHARLRPGRRRPPSRWGTNSSKIFSVSSSRTVPRYLGSRRRHRLPEGQRLRRQT